MVVACETAKVRLLCAGGRGEEGDISVSTAHARGPACPCGCVRPPSREKSEFRDLDASGAELRRENHRDKERGNDEEGLTAADRGRCRRVGSLCRCGNRR